MDAEEFFSRLPRRAAEWVSDQTEIFRVPEDYEFDDEDAPDLEDGLYWWYCLDGCLPSSDPFGPYEDPAELFGDLLSQNEDLAEELDEEFHETIVWAFGRHAEKHGDFEDFDPMEDLPGEAAFFYNESESERLSEELGRSVWCFTFSGPAGNAKRDPSVVVHKLNSGGTISDYHDTFKDPLEG